MAADTMKEGDQAPEEGVKRYICTVNLAGPADDGNIYIMLSSTPPAFTARWFIALPIQQKAMLATALTAISLQRPVQAYIQDPADPYSQVLKLYVG